MNTPPLSVPRLRPAIIVFVAVRDRLLHPRAMLAAGVLLYGVTAYETLDYPPDWLAFPMVWAALAGIAGVSAGIALVHPSRLAVVTAATCSVLAAGFRAAGLLREVYFDSSSPAVGPQRAAFIIAAVTWVGFALLWWQVYVAVVIPWTARRRAVPRP